jgi:hypothetical protein
MTIGETEMAKHAYEDVGMALRDRKSYFEAADVVLPNW